MSRISRTNLALSLMLGLLLLINWLEPGITRYEPLTGLQPEDVNSISLFQHDELLYQLTRSRKGWRLQATPELKVDQNHVRKLLHFTQLPSLYQFELDPARTEQFGLDRPGFRLQLDGLVLVFGGTDPVTKLRYLATGDKIHLVSDGYYHYLGRSPLQPGMSDPGDKNP